MGASHAKILDASAFGIEAPSDGGANRSPPPAFDPSSRAAATAVDGALWLELCRAATAELCRRKEHCNKINVFPVPDADTGTNMFLSVRGGMLACFKLHESDEGSRAHLGETCRAFSKGVLLHAQGNSGVCTSHFFGRLADEFEGKAGCSTAELVAALAAVGADMLSAMHAPVAGTYLSVVRDAAAALAAQDLGGGETAPTVRAVVDAWLVHLQAALQLTPSQLKVDGKLVLKARGVVDSGAQGFVYLVEGMAGALRGGDGAAFPYGEYMSIGPLNAVEAVGAALPETMHSHAGGEGCGAAEHNRYCTEVVLALKKGRTKAHVESALSKLGDSLAIVVSGNLLKAHVHADDPEAVFKQARKFAQRGDLLKIKAEDMRAQVRDAGLVLPNPALARTQVVWVSVMDIPDYLHPVALPWVLPFRGVLDGRPFLDRKDVSTNTMANITRRGNFKTFTTSGVGIPFFTEQIERAFAAGKEEVLVVLMPRYISLATQNNAERARDALPPAQRERVHLYNAAYIGSFGGAVVADAFERASLGDRPGAAAIAADIERRQDNMKYFIGTGMRGLIRSGRVPLHGKNRIIGPIAVKLDLKVVGYAPWPRSELKDWPELVVRAKKTGQADMTAPLKVAVAKSVPDANKKMFKALKKRIKPGTELDVFVTNPGCPHLAQGLVDLVRGAYNVRFFSFCAMTPALLGSAWYPLVFMCVRVVEPGDFSFGEGPTKESE